MCTQFTLSGALEAKRMIECCYDQAVNGFQGAIIEKNELRKLYWRERISHFMQELNWIDEILLNIKAADAASKDN